MTAHVHLVTQAADEAETIEGAPVGLPGETRPALAGLPGDEPPLGLSPEDRAAREGREAISSRAGFEAVMRALRQPHRWARPGRGEEGERRAGKAWKVEAGASYDVWAEAANETGPAGEGAQSDEVVAEDSSVAPGLTTPVTKPLWKRPVVVGGAAAIFAVSLPAIFFLSSSEPPRSVVAEPGMEAPRRELMAPAAALATVPKREAALEVPARPVPPGERGDQLQEILALRVEPKTQPKKAAPEAGEKATEGVEPAKPAQQAAAPAEAGKADPAPAAKEAREPGVNADGAVRIAAAIAVDPLVEARREAAEAAARRAAVKEQTQVLEKVTQLGALVAHLTEQINDLQGKVKMLSDGAEEKFADLGRRIALSEANRTLNAAETAQTAAPVRSGGSILALPKEQEEPARLVRAAVKAAPVAEAETPRRYRIQAASPGLAMLAGTGGGPDDTPLQVAVGAKVPGYGRITSIEQRGAAWVVQTERGPIQ